MGAPKIVLGKNDLKSQFPEVAKEAYGWDPTTTTAGSDQKKDWKCSKGHTYSSAVNNRTNGTGCPFCAGRKVLKGFNDLQSHYPDIAKEAYGWDPTTVVTGTHQKKDWRCKEGHIYSSAVNNRTNGKGCPFCAGRKVLKGFNDLQSHYPDIAAEAYGWDPTTTTAGSNQKKDWKCSKGHTYSSIVNERTSKGNGCPFCSGQQVLTGFNDLKTKFPDIASEAFGWDPATVFSASIEKRDWKCNNEHIYCTTIRLRTLRNTGCPFCSGNKVLTGFNDLKTKFPDIAAEAYGWDPATVVPGTNQKKDWRCSKGHIYSSSVNKRTGKGTGCPICAEYGFNPDKDAWFYLMERPGEQQLGISNVITDRLRTHELNGWNLIEHTTEPALGQKVLDTENAFKKWLKNEIGLMEGTSENWSTTKMEVHSLAELKARSGIETDLF